MEIPGFRRRLREFRSAMEDVLKLARDAMTTCSTARPKNADVMNSHGDWHFSQQDSRIGLLPHNSADAKRSNSSSFRHPFAMW